jgi:hypothetical protein
MIRSDGLIITSLERAIRLRKSSARLCRRGEVTCAKTRRSRKVFTCGSGAPKNELGYFPVQARHPLMRVERVSATTELNTLAIQHARPSWEAFAQGNSAVGLTDMLYP